VAGPIGQTLVATLIELAFSPGYGLGVNVNFADPAQAPAAAAAASEGGPGAGAEAAGANPSDSPAKVTARPAPLGAAAATNVLSYALAGAAPATPTAAGQPPLAEESTTADRYAASAKYAAVMVDAGRNIWAAGVQWPEKPGEFINEDIAWNRKAVVHLLLVLVTNPIYLPASTVNPRPNLFLNTLVNGTCVHAWILPTSVGRSKAV
jgi:hypothetical protein